MRKRNWFSWAVLFGLLLSQLAGCIAPISPNGASQLAGAAVEQAANPWIAMGTPGVVYTSVGAAADGTVLVTDNTNQVWRFNGSGWDNAGDRPLLQVAAGHTGNLWGVEATGEVLSYVSQYGQWLAVGQGIKAKQVSADCGSAAFTLYALDTNGVLMHKIQSGWETVAGAPTFKVLATGPGDAWGVSHNFWGITNESSVQSGNVLYHFNDDYNDIVRPHRGVLWETTFPDGKHVAVGCDGTMLVVKRNGALIRGLRAEMGLTEFIDVPGNLDSVAVGNIRNIWGIKDGQLYRWDPNTPLPYPATPTGFMRIEETEILKAHNKERAALGLSALKWSPELAKFAGDWAKQMAAAGSLQHRSIQDRTANNPLAPGQIVGENGFYRASRPYHASDYVEAMIAGEKPRYHYQNDTGNYDANGILQPPGCDAGGVCSHYTQVIWRNTQYVGCGIGTRPGNGGERDQTYVYCNYYPAGNVPGQKPY